MAQHFQTYNIEDKLRMSKSKVKNSKVIKKEIRLYSNELKLFQQGAKNHNQRISTFIKQAALAYIHQVYILPDDKQIKAFNLRFRQISNVIHNLAEQVSDFSEDKFQEIQDLLSILEASIHRIFRQPSTLDHLLKEMIAEHPQMHQWVKEQLDKMESKE